jgi:hypothetical protein
MYLTSAAQLSMVRAMASARALGTAAKTGRMPPIEAESISWPVTRSRQRYWPCGSLHSVSRAARPAAARARLRAAISGSPQLVGEGRQVGGRADQDGIETGIDHLERRGVVQPGVVPAERAEQLHQIEVAIILRLGRAMCRIGVLGVAAHVRLDPIGRDALEGLVPVDRIVTAGLPGVEDGDKTLVAGVAHVVEPAVPGVDPGQQGTGAPRRLGLVGGAIVKALDGKAGDRRLSDARGRGGGARCPRRSGPGK